MFLSKSEGFRFQVFNSPNTAQIKTLVSELYDLLSVFKGMGLHPYVQAFY